MHNETMAAQPKSAQSTEYTIFFEPAQNAIRRQTAAHLAAISRMSAEERSRIIPELTVLLVLDGPESSVLVVDGSNEDIGIDMNNVDVTVSIADYYCEAARHFLVSREWHAFIDGVVIEIDSAA